MSRGSVVAKSVVAMALLAAGTAVAQQVVYSSIPYNVPGNVSSLGYEATATAEFGDRVQLLEPPFLGRGVPPVPGTVNIRKVTVLMSSWGCQTGSWVTSNCVTTPGATFQHPITLNLYADGTPGSLLPGSLLFTKTQTFAIPYRPSTSAGCPGGAWMQTTLVRGGPPATQCYNGLATKITFNFEPAIAVPKTLVWGIAYNTTHYGANPIGQAAPCFSSSGGCGYDSLNVGAKSFNPIVGVDVDPNGAFWNTSHAPFYCDGGAAGAGTFRLDDSPTCWTDYRPMIEFAQY